MANSINTNSSAIVALRSLSSTATELNQVQKRISTGYQVADAVDDGAAFSVAQSLRSQRAGIDAVNSQINVARGAVTVFSSAATNISDALARSRETLVKLADQNLTSDMRAKYTNDFTALRSEVQNYLANAKFNGINLLGGTQMNIAVVASQDGAQYTIGGANGISLSAAVALAFATPATAASAVTLLTSTFASAEKRTGDALNTLGADARRLDAQVKYNTSTQDSLTISLGAIVDTDLAKDSARLQALQIRQQLGAQTLGIANQAPQIFASLFR